MIKLRVKVVPVVVLAFPFIELPCNDDGEWIDIEVPGNEWHALTAHRKKYDYINTKIDQSLFCVKFEQGMNRSL